MSTSREPHESRIEAVAEEDAALVMKKLVEVIRDCAVDEVMEKLRAGRQAESTRTRLVSVPEAAARLGRSADAVYKMIARGQIRAVRAPTGRRRHIQLGELERFIEQSRIAGSCKRDVI